MPLRLSVEKQRKRKGGCNYLEVQMVFQTSVKSIQHQELQEYAIKKHAVTRLKLKRLVDSKMTILIIYPLLCHATRVTFFQ